MYIKANNITLTLPEGGIIENQDNIILTFADVTESLEELETNLNGLSTIDVYGDNDTVVRTFNGYIKLLSITKDYNTGNISVKLGQPTLIIKGLSNTEEIKAILEKQGYTVE